MADSTTNLEQIESSQAQKEITANGLFDALSPSAFGGRRAEGCSGLRFAYYGGRYAGSTVANGYVDCPGASTSYLVANRSTGAVSLDTYSPTHWADTDNYARLYKITTSGAAITSYEDHRLGPGGLLAAGAGAVALSGLSDVDAAGLADKALLQYDSGALKWGMKAHDAVLALGDLTDTATAGQAAGDVLRYSGSAWLPHTLDKLLSLSNLSDLDITSSPAADAGDTLVRDADGKWRPKDPKTTAASPIGRHSIPIMASAMSPSVSGGCAPLVGVATSANHPDLQTLDFDASAIEYAQFAIPMPKKWDGGTVTARFLWSHAATATNFGVVWALQAVAVGDDDTIDAAFGTAQSVTDTGGTTSDLYRSGETPAITVAGSPAAEDMVFFRVYRDATNGSDNLAIDARLHAVILYINTNAATDA